MLGRVEAEKLHSSSFCRAFTCLVMIFSDTIAHNIALDTDRLEMDRVHRAAIMANVDGFVRKKNGESLAAAMLQGIFLH